MNQRIIVLIGISGSGKGTWAKDFIANSKDYVRVNRDSIREQLTGLPACVYNQNPKADLEKQVSDVQHEQIRYFLNKGKNIILDNTHLKRATIDDILFKYTHLCDIELKWFDIDYKVAQRRVLLRDRGISEGEFPSPEQASNSLSVAYIERQSKEYMKLLGVIREHYYPKVDYSAHFDLTKPTAIICDLDGTLAEAGDRNLYDRDYENDHIVPAVCETIYALQQQGHHLIFVSGRKSKYEASTREFLQKCGISNYKLFMREEGDLRKDSIVKMELFNSHIRDNYNVLCCFDDRLSVIEDCWDKLGIFTYNVNYKHERY